MKRKRKGEPGSGMKKYESRRAGQHYKAYYHIRDLTGRVTREPAMTPGTIVRLVHTYKVGKNLNLVRLHDKD